MKILGFIEFSQEISVKEIFKVSVETIKWSPSMKPHYSVWILIESSQENEKQLKTIKWSPISWSLGHEAPNLFLLDLNQDKYRVSLNFHKKGVLTISVQKNIFKVSVETIKWSPSPATWARTTERGAISSEFPWQGKTDSSVGGGQASEIYHLLDVKLNN